MHRKYLGSEWVSEIRRKVLQHVCFFNGWKNVIGRPLTWLKNVDVCRACCVYGFLDAQCSSSQDPSALLVFSTHPEIFFCIYKYLPVCIQSSPLICGYLQFPRGLEAGDRTHHRKVIPSSLTNATSQRLHHSPHLLASHRHFSPDVITGRGSTGQ